MSVARKKIEARRRAEIQRKKAHEKMAVTASQKVAGFLEDFLLNEKFSSAIEVVAAYIQIKTELDLKPSIERLIRQGKKICLPIIVERGKPLVFAEWDGKSELVKGEFNVPAPTTRFILEPDLIICPLLSYDTLGYRLGYGGGFYDRTIANLERQKKQFLAIGCGYSNQLSKTMLPIDEYDKRLDGIVTEKGLFLNKN